MEADWRGRWIGKPAELGQILRLEDYEGGERLVLARAETGKDDNAVQLLRPARPRHELWLGGAAGRVFPNRRERLRRDVELDNVTHKVASWEAKAERKIIFLPETTSLYTQKGFCI